MWSPGILLLLLLKITGIQGERVMDTSTGHRRGTNTDDDASLWAEMVEI